MTDLEEEGQVFREHVPELSQVKMKSAFNSSFS